MRSFQAVHAGDPDLDALRAGKKKNHVALKFDFEDEHSGDTTRNIPGSSGVRHAQDVHWDSVGSNDTKYAGSNESDEPVDTGASVDAPTPFLAHRLHWSLDIHRRALHCETETGQYHAW